MTGILRFGLAALALGIALSASPTYADMKSARHSYLRGDHKVALTEFQRLAEAGDVDAQSRLAEMYVTGRGAPEDQALAIKWFTAAAEQGDVPAQVNLGLLLAQDAQYEAAAKWFGLASARGDGAAMNNMAAFYMRGLGVPQDIPKAFVILEKVAELGDPNDQLQLGMMYLQGMGGAPDMENGLKWLTRSARQGHADAQMRLGAVLAEAEDVKDRLVLAYKWVHLASMQGTENAGPTLKGLTLQMTREQIADAKRRAAAWRPDTGK